MALTNGSTSKTPSSKHEGLRPFVCPAHEEDGTHSLRWPRRSRCTWLGDSCGSANKTYEAVQGPPVVLPAEEPLLAEELMMPTTTMLLALLAMVAALMMPTTTTMVLRLAPPPPALRLTGKDRDRSRRRPAHRRCLQGCPRPRQTGLRLHLHRHRRLTCPGRHPQKRPRALAAQGQAVPQGPLRHQQAAAQSDDVVGA